MTFCSWTINGSAFSSLTLQVTVSPPLLSRPCSKVHLLAKPRNATDPAKVLTSLNHALCGKFESHFVTAAYVFIDLDAKRLRYSGAGHPPVLFVNRSSGAARAIEQNGLFLGMFPGAEYASLEIPLQSGDRYLLYTDGLPESKNVSAEEFSLARCKQFLESHSNLPA